MVGSALVRALQTRRFQNLVLRTRQELDLQDARAVRAFFSEERPAYVFIAAARVGGILANATYPVEFLTENLQITLNLMSESHAHGVKKLLFLGSSCIYPKYAEQPLREDALLTGSLEPTNEAYALAKICGIRLAEYYAKQYQANFISVMPTNLYGLHDNFDLKTSHVIPALLRKFHEAKVRDASEVILWGTGQPRREFMHADDLAEACLFLMEKYHSPQFLNAGVGYDVTIAELAGMIQELTGFHGKIVWDTSKPDGTPRKLMDSSRLHALGWKPRIGLAEGLSMAYHAWLKQGADSA